MARIPRIALWLVSASALLGLVELGTSRFGLGLDGSPKTAANEPQQLATSDAVPVSTTAVQATDGGSSAPQMSALAALSNSAEVGAPLAMAGSESEGGIALAAPVAPNPTLTADQHASRFLAQATFGPSPASITELRNLSYNYSNWIDLEAAKPVSSAVALLQTAMTAGVITTFDQGNNRRARTQVMLAGSDQLRQRIAYALSQILVISDADSNVVAALEGSSSYYDMLARNALGNFRTLLMDVTRHPMMGRYLSHYRNRKANTTAGIRPDENFAREVMQLFSIGLYNLNADGSYQTDTAGRPIESYTNDDITEFARVFTGFMDASTSNTGTGGGATDFPNVPVDYTNPMRMWGRQHDTGAKILLRYTGARRPNLPALPTVPTDAQAFQDVQDAIDNLVEHPNTAPFISRILIQRLVTSNPSRAYIGRVAAVFANNGSGVRGDLLAVVKAILLDTDARSTTTFASASHGKLIEPFLRVTYLLRALKFTVTTPASTRLIMPYDFGSTFSEATMGQFPMGSPSVFNFYSPDYDPPGIISAAGLVGPEYQILNSVFAVTTPNGVYSLLQSGAGQFRVSTADQEALAATPVALLDNLDLLLTHGTLSPETRATVQAAMAKVTTANGGSNINLTRVQLAIYLIALSPDFAIFE